MQRPSQFKCKITLDHAENDRSGNDDDGPVRRTNMQWLTRSDLAGLPRNNPLVQETIDKAQRDVPEVTQVCVCGGQGLGIQGFKPVSRRRGMC